MLTLLTYPYVYLPVRGAARASCRASLEESARLLGRAGRGDVPCTVVAAAGCAARSSPARCSSFLYAISDFGAVQLLRYDTLTRAIYANRLLDPPSARSRSASCSACSRSSSSAGERAFRGPPAPPWRRAARPAPLRALGRWRLRRGGRRRARSLGLALAAPVAVLGYWASAAGAGQQPRQLGRADLAAAGRSRR